MKHNFYVKDTPRASDDAVLYAMAERQRGVPMVEIARLLGLRPPYLSTMIQRVKAADIQECATWGDSPTEVRRFYG